MKGNRNMGLMLILIKETHKMMITLVVIMQFFLIIYLQ